MHRRTAIVLALGVLCGISPAASGQDATSDPEGFFESKVRPVLAAKCVECHGPAKASGGLRLDSRDGLFKGGDSGPAVVPGDVEHSLLAIAIKQGFAYAFHFQQLIYGIERPVSFAVPHNGFCLCSPYP